MISNFKTFAINDLSSSHTAQIGVKVSFASFGSSLRFLYPLNLGADFNTIGITSGMVIIGDGTTNTNFTLDAANVDKFTKVNSFSVKSSSQLNLQTTTGLNSVIQIADGAEVVFEDGVHAVNVQSITAMSFSTARVKAKNCTFTGDWSSCYGELKNYDGKTMSLNFSAASFNPMKIKVGDNSNTTATILSKLGGLYTLGITDNTNCIEMYPYSSFDLGSASNTANTDINGNIAIYE